MPQIKVQSGPAKGRVLASGRVRSEAEAIAREEAMKMRALWLTVIKTAFDDMKLTVGDYAELTAQQARTWLTSNSRDFREVCALAGVDPDKVRAVALKRCGGLF